MKPNSRLNSLLLTLVCLGSTLAAVSTGITRDIPVGTISGTVVMRENKRSLPDGFVSIRSMNSSSEDQMAYRTARTDKDGKFKFAGVPEGKYEIYASGEVHSQEKPLFVTVEEGKASEQSIQLIPAEDKLSISMPAPVFLPGERPAATLYGFTDERDVNIQIYQLSVNRMALATDWVNKVQSSAWRGEIASAMTDLGGTQIGSFTHTVQERQPEGQFQNRIQMPQGGEGVYLLEAKAGKLSRVQIYYISQIAAIAKVGDSKVNVSVVDLKSGSPIAGANLKSNNVNGLTDANGLADFNLAQLKGETNQALIVATYGKSTAVVSVPFYGSEDRGATYIQTDRTLYRPKDTVNFRAVLRLRKGESYALPQAKTAEVSITDADGEDVAKFEVPVTGFGTVNGSFQLPNAVKSCEINVSCDGLQAYEWVNVSSYRKPEYRIVVEPLNKIYFRGDKAKFRVRAEYFFGGAVPNAHFEGDISYGALYRWEDSILGESEETSWEDNTLDPISGDLNESGEAIVEVDTTRMQWPIRGQVDQQVTLNVSMNAGEGRWFDGSGKVRVMRGDVDVQLSSDVYWVSPGTSYTVTLTAKDAATGDALSGRKIVITGSQSFDWGQPEHQIFKDVLTTDATGVATKVVRADRSGTLTVRADTVDSEGRRVEATNEVWVYDEGASFQQEGLTIKVDKKQYKPGERVKAIVVGAAPGSFAWFTLEGLDVMDQRVTKLKEGVNQVEFTVPSITATNAFVSATIVSNKRMIEAISNFKIENTSHDLSIKIKPDKTNLKPGDSLQVQLMTTNQEGAPVSAELALATVDEGIFELLEDTSDPKEAFYSDRYPSISTTNSFPVVYLDGGDKGEQKVDIRKDFRDTAQWNPTILTDANGTASVTIKLPDNLTEWRLTAVGFTKDTKIGKTKTSVAVNKDLMVRVAAPLSMTAGDTISVATLLNNSTSTELKTTVSLVAEKGSVGPTSPRVVSVPGKGQAMVNWDVTAKSSGSLKLRAIATSPSASDGMELSVPVQENGVWVRKGGFGTAPYLVSVPEPSSNRGETTLHLSSSILTSLIPGIKDLVDYPYGCVEQTMSRFAPAIVALHTMRAAGIEDPALEAKIEKVSADALARLQSFQHADGGFGWWQYDESNPRMTGLVIDGLGYAKEAGLKVPDRMLASAKSWADNHLKLSDLKAYEFSEQLALASAVAKYNPQRAELASMPLATSAEDLSLQLEIWAYSNNDALADAAQNALMQKASSSDTEISWATSYWGETIAPRILRALVIRGRTADDVLARIARGVLVKRKGNGWHSTYDTGLAIQALVLYAAKTGELGNSPEVSVTVDGKRIFQGTLGNQVVTLQAGVSAKSIQVESQGRVYVSWEQRSLLASSQVKPSSSGLQIERTFTTLSRERNSNGQMSLVPGPAKTEFRTGDLIKAKVVVKTDVDRDYILVDVPIPANCRATERESVDYWSYWYTGNQVFDDHVAMFVRTLPKGEHVFEVNLRAEQAGTATARPCETNMMYDPTVAAFSIPLQIVVRPQ